MAGLAVCVLLLGWPALRAAAAPPAGPAPPPLPPAAGPGVEGVAALRGDFVSGVVVLAFASPGPGPKDKPLARSAGTDDSGRYRLALAPGSYYLVAVRTAGSAWPFPGAKGDLFCYYLGNPIVVEPGKMTRVGFNMVRVGDPPAAAGGEGAGIAGQVLFEDKPLGRAYVHVYRDVSTNFRGMGLASVPTGDDGRFRVKLPPGDYYVLARKRQGGGMYGPPGKDDFIGYLPGNPVAVRAGAFTPLALETTTRVDLLEEIWFTEGSSAGWFEGSVAEAGGKPGAGLYVLFYADAAMTGAPAFVAGPTDEQGRFKVRAAAGTFHLLARSHLGGPLEAGEWYGRAVLAGGAAPAGGIRISVERYRGK
ncbi:MAG TPA: hypothetical protein VN317_10965 [Candidatus Methanoperedens sp.]|nr:hypothetical protein [Candidatus Methanoperedens sp.]